MARTTVATDDFNRADGAMGSNWTHLYPGWADSDIAGNVAVAADTSNEQVARWDGAGTFTDDQGAIATVGGIAWQTDSYRCGVIARASADTNANRDYYAFYASLDAEVNKATRLVRCVNGTQTTIASTTAAWANGDTIAIEVVTTDGATVNVKGFRNGTEVLNFDDTNAARLLTGKPGIYQQGSATYGTLDDWSGFNVTAGSSGPTGAQLSRMLLGIG